MAIGSIKFNISADLKEFRESMKEVSETAKGAGEQLKKTGKQSKGMLSTLGGIAKAVGAFKLVNSAINMVTSSIGDAVKRVDILNNSSRVFENMGFSAQETEIMMKSLTKSITGLPTPMQDAVQGVQLLASSMGDLGKSEQVYASLNNAILGFGGTTGQVQNAITQLSQAFSNGKVDAQTWNSMINSGMGPALNALAKQMGITTGQFKSGLSSGSISVKQFQDSLIELNEKGGGGLKSLQQIARDSTAGIGTGLSNMRTAIVRGVANIVTSIDEALKGLNLGGIGSIIANVGTLMEKGLTAIATAVPKVVTALQKLGSIPAIQKFKESAIQLGSTVKEVFETVAPVALNLFKTVGSAVFSYVAPMVESAVSALADFGKTASKWLTDTVIPALQTFGNWVNNNKSTVEAFGAVVIALGTAFAVFKVITGVVTAFNTLKTGLIAVKAAMAAFNAVLMANPIALIIAAVAALAAAFTYLWKVNEGFRNAVMGIWNSIKQSFISAKEAVLKAWDSVTSFFSDLWTNIKDTASSAITGLIEAWNSFSSYLSNLWATITAVASTAWTQFTQVITAIAQPFITWFMNLWNGMKDGLQLIWQGIQTIAAGAWELIKNVILAPVLLLIDLLTGDFESMGSHLTQIWENIKNAASTIWNGIKQYFTGVVTAIVGLVKAQFNNMKAVLTAVWNAIKTVATAVWNSLKASVTNIVKATVNTAKAVWNGFRSFLSGLWSSVKATASSSWNSIKSSVTNIISGIVNAAKQKWNQLKSDVKNALNIVKNTFNSLRNINLFSIGQNIIQGLVNGIRNMVGAVGRAISDVASNVKNRIKGALGIHSPSRFMRDEIGENLMLGLAIGIQDEARSPLKAINDVASSIKKAAATEGTFSRNMVATGSYTVAQPAMAIAGVMTSNSSSTESTIGDGVTINVQSMVVRQESDIKKIGKQLADEAYRHRRFKGKGWED